MTYEQELALAHHNLTKHSMRNGCVIAKEHDGWVLVLPDGSVEFHISSLKVAQAEADCA